MIQQKYKEMAKYYQSLNLFYLDESFAGVEIFEELSFNPQGIANKESHQDEPFDVYHRALANNPKTDSLRQSSASDTSKFEIPSLSDF